MRPRSDQRHEVQVSSRWELQSPGQVRPCLGSESPGTGEAQVETESPGTEEAKVRTRVNRSGWVTVSEECNHILMLSKLVPEIQGPREGQVGPET